MRFRVLRSHELSKQGLLMLRLARKKLIVLFLLAFAQVVIAEPPSPELSNLLPKRLGEFRQLPSMRPLVTLAREGLITPSDFRVDDANQQKVPFLGGESEYLSAKGERLTIEIVRLNQDSDAYSFLTLVATKMRQVESTQITLGAVGTASITSARSVAFYKGNIFLRVSNASPQSNSSETLLALARLFADRFDKGEGEIPVLVKHLPNWQQVQGEALYVVGLETLKSAFSNQPVFDAMSFDGGAEAVTANYGNAKLVIVEFNTPQLATDNDQRITAKLQELRSQGQPAPTAYRRVGNYSVFVFDAPSQEIANQLIDQVKYEQMVQWLGENPYRYERALREFSQTTLGVFVNVVKGSGLALISCLLVGGLFGGLLFIRRRAQQREAEAYADAGAMLRLNLDELTPEMDPGRLLGRGK